MTQVVRVPSSDLDAITPPYTYNPSAWIQRLPICLIAFVAALISAHLAMFQYGLIESTWDPVFGDQSNKVLKSDIAQQMHGWFGIHDAALGMFAYLGDAIFGFAGSTRRWQHRPWMVILFGIDVIPLGLVSVILVMCQAFVIGYWCFLCLVTAALSLILVYWAWDEVRVTVTYLWKVWSTHRRWSLLWRAFWGYRDRESELVAESLLRQGAK